MGLPRIWIVNLLSANRNITLKKHIFTLWKKWIISLKIDELKVNFLKAKKFISPSKYPPVKRDIAFIIAENIKVEDIKNEIRSACRTILKKVELFDIFAGGKIEKNINRKKN